MCKLPMQSGFPWCDHTASLFRAPHRVKSKSEEAAATVGRAEVAIDPGRLSAETSDGVTTITFSHPKSNSLPGPLLAQLADSVRAAGRDPATTVIVLRSEGTGAFCAG